MTAARTFAFADLSGYTALTEVHGDEDAAAVASRFAALARQALAGSGQLVKTIGDAVMLSLSDPMCALRTIAALRALCRVEPHFPALRIGLHHGPAVERDGDYFGAAVNLAARIAAHAELDQVLCTASVAVVCSTLSGFEATQLGPVSFRNVAEPVVIYEVRIAHACDVLTIDPVCRMRVDPRSAVRLEVHGVAHLFCSEACAALFSRRQSLPPATKS